MVSQNCFIYQDLNIVDSITASVSPSEKEVRVITESKGGTGTVHPYGQFNASDDIEYQLRVTSLAGFSVANNPTFHGVGSGVLQYLNVNSLANQRIRVICVDVGTDSEYASFIFEGLEFKAKTIGSGGNSIYMIIDDTNLVFNDTISVSGAPKQFATITELAVGATAVTGPEWDFDTKALNYDLVPDTAHRLAFGNNRVHVYTQYKDYVDGIWTYYFLRPIQYRVKKGARVYFVEGSRTITLTDGTSTSEIYTNIITSQDFWTAVKNNSNMIEPVDNAIDTARHIESPATREITTKTSAHFVPSYGEGSKFADEVVLEQVEIDSDASTELIEIKCINNDSPGSELWSVKGGVSGELQDATTGVLYHPNEAGFDFLIPQRLPDGYFDIMLGGTRWSYEFIPIDEETGQAALCFSFQLGINAKTQSLKLEYKKIEDPLACPTVDFDEGLLGLPEEPLEGGDDVGFTVPDLVTWTEVTYQRMKEQFGASGSSTSLRQRYAGEGIFEVVARPVFCEYKKLAKRIYDLPYGDDGDDATLVAMTASFKAIVNATDMVIDGLGNVSWTGSGWNPAPTSGYTTPEGHYIYTVQERTATGSNVSDEEGLSNKSEYVSGFQFTGSGVTDCKISTTAFGVLWDEVLTYETTYGVKKNITLSACAIISTDTYHWVFVQGDKPYLPVSTGEVYYSKYLDAAGAVIESREFALSINLASGTFLEGDIIEIEINQPEVEKTFQLGDIVYLPIIGPQSLYLAGGVDGNDRYLFDVRGTINSFDQYTLSKTTPVMYNYPTMNSTLSFFIDEGDIDFAVGDYFEFYVEGGKFQWKSKPYGGAWGAWSGSLNLDPNIQTLDSGIKVAFSYGSYPSYELYDTWTLLATQENRTSNMLNPQNLNYLKYKGNDEIIFDAGSSQIVQFLILDNHTITSDILFSASNVSDFSVLIDQRVISNNTLICELFNPVITARYYKIEPADSTSWTDIQIGYFFLGQSLQLSLDADNITPVPKWRMEESVGKEPFNFFRYKQVGFNVVYDTFYPKADYDNLITMIEYTKSNNDQPLYFVPNLNITPVTAYRVKVDVNEFQPGMPMNLNAPEAYQKYAIGTLPLLGSV